MKIGKDAFAIRLLRSGVTIVFLLYGTTLPLILSAQPQQPAAAKKRVALVLGIEKYEALAPLSNPVLDARTMAELLAKQGFDVSAYYDLNRDELEEALSAFSAKSDGADTALIYYSGHGMEIVDKNDHFNVLAPVDARIDCDTRKASRFVRVDELFRTTKGVGNQVVFIDACRDIAFQRCPPKRDTGNEGRGYGFRAFVPDVRDGEAILVTYSTSQKGLARDGEPGQHSPFAKILLNELRTSPDTYFLQLVNRIIVKVGTATNFKQVPSLSLEGGVPQTCLSGKACNEGIVEDAETRAARARTLGQLATRHMDNGEYVTATLLALEGLDQEVRRLWPEGNVPRSYNSDDAMIRRSRHWAGKYADTEASVPSELPRILYEAAEKSRERELFPVDVAELGRVITLSHDGTKAFIVSGQEPSYIWDLQVSAAIAKVDVKATGMTLFGPTGPTLHVSTLAAFSPDGNILATISNKQEARIWNARTGASLSTLRDASGIESVAFNKNGTRAISTTKNGNLTLWEVHTGKKLKAIALKSQTLAKVALSSDGEWALLTASGNPTVEIIEVKSGVVRNVLKGHRASVNSAAFSPDGKRIVTASTDETVRVWDALTGEPRMVLRGHRGSVAQASYSPDGTQIVSFDLEGFAARVWGADTGEELALLAGHLGRIESVAFGSDKRLLTASTTDNTIRYWDISDTPGQAIVSTMWGGDSYFLRPHWFQLDAILRGPARIALLEFAITMMPRCLTPQQRSTFGLPTAPPQWCISLKKWPYIKQSDNSSRR